VIPRFEDVAAGDELPVLSKVVTREDVKAVAREVFRTNGMSAALIGPFKDKKRFMKLLRVPS